MTYYIYTILAFMQKVEKLETALERGKEAQQKTAGLRIR